MSKAWKQWDKLSTNWCRISEPSTVPPGWHILGLDTRFVCNLGCPSFLISQSRVDICHNVSTVDGDGDDDDDDDDDD